MRLLPANCAETITAWKCWPSPITSTCSHARPPSMPCFTLSGVTISRPQFVARFEQQKAGRRHRDKADADDGQARLRGHIGGAEEAVAEAVDHVEERIAM